MSLGGPRPRSVVLDGELLVYDEVGTPAGTYDELGNAPGIVGFGTIHWVKCGGYGKAPSNYSRADCRRHLFFKALDVLHLDGVDVMHRPLSERRRILEERCFVAVPRYVERTSCRRYDLRLQPRAVHDAFAWAQSRGEEGLMVKSAAQPSATVRKKISRIAKKRFDSSLNRSAEKTITPQPTRERQALPPTMYLPRGAAVLDSAKKQHEAAGAP